MKRSSGSPEAGADVRQVSFMMTSEEHIAEKRGQRGEKRGRGELDPDKEQRPEQRGQRGEKRERGELKPDEEQRAGQRGQRGATRGRGELEHHTAVNINKAIVQLGCDHKWKEMLSMYEKQKGSFSNINYATTMSQLGRIRSIRKDAPLLKAFLDDLSKKFDVHGFAWIGNQGIANIVHAIGKMHLSSNDSAMRIVRRLEDDDNVTSLFENGTPQNISNSVWACAKLGIKSPNLFGELETNATWLVENGNPQNIANCVWACATLGIKSTNLFGELERNSTRLVENGTQQDIANCAWACATLRIKSPNLFGELERKATWLFQNGNSQDIANSVWACATL